jgi:hypothetical protein
MRNSSAVEPEAGKPEAPPPARFAAFAQFFKAYMGTASVVTAALPIPVAALHLIPTYAAQEKYLSTYTSMFCFLMLAYFFYIRHWLGRLMFYTATDGNVRFRTMLTWIPFLLILSSLGLVVLYHHYLEQSFQFFDQVGVINRNADLLKTADAREISDSVQLTACYLGMFVTAEAAFILMALREYLQDVLKLHDASLIRLRTSSRARKTTAVVSHTVEAAVEPAPR